MNRTETAEHWRQRRRVRDRHREEILKAAEQDVARIMAKPSSTIAKRSDIMAVLRHALHELQGTFVGRPPTAGHSIDQLEILSPERT